MRISDTAPTLAKVDRQGETGCSVANRVLFAKRRWLERQRDEMARALIGASAPLCPLRIRSGETAGAYRASFGVTRPVTEA